MTSDTWTVSGPQTIDVDGVTAVDATILTGRIDVVAHDNPARTDARVEVHAVEGRPLEVRLEGGTLRVSAGAVDSGWKGFVERFRSYSGLDRADVQIAVPPNAHVRVRTVRGDALVAGVRSGVRAATVYGSIVTTHTSGTARVDTVSGDVTLSEHDGDVTMDSVSGELTATGALGALRFDSVSGDITADSRTTPESTAINTVSGSVLLRVPDPAALDYAVRCVSGRLLVDGTEYRSTAGSALKRPAQSGAEGRSLRLSAVSGNITVLRGDAEYGFPDAPIADAPVPDAPFADAPIDELRMEGGL